MARKTGRTGLIGKAAALGVVAGMRSQLPLAFLARTAGTAGERLFRWKLVRSGLYFGAAFEMVGDKQPLAPSRIDPGPRSGRVVFGAVSGAILARRFGGSGVAGAVAGSAGALAGTYAGYHARAWLGRTTGTPDPLLALVEDGVALTVSSLVVRR